MNNKPKITIITPCYNSAATIQDTLNAVKAQNYQNLEHIFIDSCSTDGTLDILNVYREEVSYDVKIVSEKDNGIYDAMNKGIAMATGDIIGISNSDDWYEAGALEEVAASYKGNKYEIIYGMKRTFDNGILRSVEFYSHEFLMEQMICHPACFVTKAVYEDKGVFDLSFRSSSDYDWMIKRFMEKDVVFTPVYKILANMRRGGMSDTNVGYRETLKLMKQYGQKSGFYYRFNVAKSYISDFCKRIK